MSPSAPGAAAEGALARAEAAIAAGREAEAEAALAQLLAAGEGDLRAHLLHAKLLQGQNRFAETERSLRAALSLAPGAPEVHRELAQLVWMRTGAPELALEALRAAPTSAALTVIEVRLLEEAGAVEAAYGVAVARAARFADLHYVAAKVCASFDPLAAERHLRALPAAFEASARSKLAIEVDLALGRADLAARRAEALRAARPGDHYVTALLGTAWRLMGDPRGPWLCDYDRLVTRHAVTTPAGWRSRDDFLAELARDLSAAHGPLTHPIGQSVRHGSQTFKDLRAYGSRAVAALMQALDAPVRSRLAATGGGDYRVSGAWSVRLRPGGRHIDHVHAEGWLSSAFYVRLPGGLKHGEGALTFGRPGPPTRPALAAERLVQPEVGLLVLFPAYMWHGTTPFEGGGERLACAFDIVRRRPRS
jgi:tetratricopeptide (TPR) repeat protein